MPTPNHHCLKRRSRRPERAIAIFAVAILGLTSACASPPLPTLPRITELPTELEIPGKFVWMDLVTRDPAAARRFYSQLFDWKFDGDESGEFEGEDADRPYTRILHEGTPIGGIIQAADPERVSEWVGNLSVADVDRATRFAKDHGGVVETGPVDAPDRGRMALVSDAEGSLVLILRAYGGDPEDELPKPGSWLWHELSTHDVEAARRFYTGLVGFEAETLDVDGRVYVVLRSGGYARAGILEAPSFVNPHWLPYIRVEQPERVAERARQLGARVVVADTDSAILIDPTGAPFAIQHWDEKPIPRGEKTQ